MNDAMEILYLIALVVWVGSHAAFRLLFTGVIFKRLNAGTGLKILQLVLPRLCALGWVLAPAGIVLVALMLTDGVFARLPGILSLLALAGMASTTLALRQPALVLGKLPEEEIRKAAAMDTALPPAAQAQWDAVRKLTIQVNAVQLLLGLVLLCALVLGVKN